MTNQQPTEQQIQDCMRQIQSKQNVTHNLETQKLAQLRLMNFTPLLGEWAIDDPKLQSNQKPMPKVAAAFANPNLNAEQAQKLLVHLQQNAKNGNTTAMLYLAYAYAAGKYTEVSPKKSASCALAALKQNDWRAARLLGELLAYAPALSAEILGEENQAATKAWLQKHPEYLDDFNKIKKLLSDYLNNPNVIKWAAKQKFIQAQNLGSPTAEQRMRGLAMTGILSQAAPARQYQSIENYLEIQCAPQAAIESDDDMMILPDHIPLIPDEEEETPVWHKAAIVGGLLLCGGMISLLIFRFLA